MFAMTPAVFSLLADETGSLDAFPEAASTFAADIDRLFWFISIVCIVFFVAITYCLIQFTLRYHKPKGEKAESSATHNTPLELAWSVLPSFFLIAMFVMGAQAYLDHRTVPDGANELRVKAYKWDWGIDYGRGVINPELHILLGEPTKLTMVSDDVIHSLYIPAFRAKKDVVPGRFNYMWFKPTVASEKVDAKILEEAKTWHESLEGKAWAKDSSDSWNYDRFQFTADGYTFFDLYCAEYCGTNHSEMQTVVVVHETLDDLNAWIKKYSKRQPGETPAEYGRLLYQRRGCVGCHSEDGIKRTGPTFQNLYGSEHLLANGESVKVDEEYIRESINYPKAKIVAGYAPAMPSFKGQLSEDDLYCLVEYLKSLSNKGGEEAKAKPEQSAETDQE